MTVAVPTLSTLGWVRAPAEKADFLFSHFYTSDKFQTYLYGDQVANVQWLVEQYGHDPLTFCQHVKTTLEQYLGRYYDFVLVEATSDDDATYNASPNQGTQIKVRLYVRVTENGKDYTFAKLISASDSKFQAIIDLNNEGSAS